MSTVKRTSLIAGPLAKRVIESLKTDRHGSHAQSGRWRAAAYWCKVKGEPSGGLLLSASRDPYQHEGAAPPATVKRLRSGWTYESAKRHLADLIEGVRLEHSLNLAREALFQDVERAKLRERHLGHRLAAGEKAGHTSLYDRMNQEDIDYWRKALKLDAPK